MHHRFLGSTTTRFYLELSPNHLVHYADVALDDPHHLSADILIHIIWNGDAVVTIFDQFYSHVNALQEANGVNSTQHEAAFI